MVGDKAMAMPPGRRKIPAWAWLGLLAILLLDVWWRGHTFGPVVRDRWGLDLWPVSGSEGEPLDCDEALYTYYGRRMGAGAVMYRDLTEFKPPAGYWLYAAAVAIGGPTEASVRFLPIPIVLATLPLIWGLTLRLAGPGTACLAAAIYAIASTDPYLYGNGSQLELPLNLGATAALALMVAALSRGGRGRIVAAGACLGTAFLIKQVAVTHLAVFGIALLVRHAPRGLRWARIRDLLALGVGFVAVVSAAVAILIAQGAGPSAFDDVIRYGAALARDTPPPAHAPPTLLRWIVGNSDPRDGSLPWPFGDTEYLPWWGTGTWPLWLGVAVAVPYLLLGPTTAGRRLVAGWTLSAWVQVALPGLFWPHYYLLPLPGVAVGVALLLGDLAGLARRRRSWWCAFAGGLGALTLGVGLAWTAMIQVRDYLLRPPSELGKHCKGGEQWLSMRTMGRDLGQRSAVWKAPRLYVWGWQTPFHVYSGLDGVTREAFVDPLLQSDPGGAHPLVRPRLERIMRDLRARPPELIEVGDPAFPALRAFLDAGYRRSHLDSPNPEGRGLWVERGHFREFETFPVRPRPRRHR